jgi:hypothetical protein
MLTSIVVAAHCSAANNRPSRANNWRLHHAQVTHSRRRSRFGPGRAGRIVRSIERTCHPCTSARRARPARKGWLSAQRDTRVPSLMSPKIRLRFAQQSDARAPLRQLGAALRCRCKPVTLLSERVRTAGARARSRPVANRVEPRKAAREDRIRRDRRSRIDAEAAGSGFENRLPTRAT